MADNAVTLVRTTLPAIPVDVQAYYRANVVPAGAKDDGNKKYTLPEAIVAGSLQLFCNGVLLTPTTDYIISGVTITLTTDMFAPSAGTVLLATYIKA